MIVVRNRVREMREARGWSQATLADKAGVNRNTVLAIEAWGSSPKVDVIAKLCGALDCELSDLFWSEREETAVVA